MSLPRCPRCRSSVNPAVFKRCIGCGAEVGDALPTSTGVPTPHRRQHVIVEGTKDAGMTFTVLAVLGILGVAGFITSFLGGSGYGMILTGTCAVAGSVSGIVRINRPARDNNLGVGCRVFATLFLLGLALIFGLGILLGVTCVQGGGNLN